jgi:hypothetical protein
MAFISVQSQHLAVDQYHRTRLVCLGVSLSPDATCTLPIGVSYLLTYLLTVFTAVYIKQNSIPSSCHTSRDATCERLPSFVGCVRATSSSTASSLRSVVRSRAHRADTGVLHRRNTYFQACEHRLESAMAVLGTV